MKKCACKGFACVLLQCGTCRGGREAGEGKKRRIIMRQGNDNKAGTKHSIYGHYATRSDYYMAEEILLIPEIIRTGERNQEGGKVAYEIVRDGITYTVTTEQSKSGLERFTNFYTNGEPTAVVNDTSNTDEQHVSQQSVPGAKLQKVSEYDKEETEKKFDAAKRYQKVSPVFYSNAERAVEGVKQGKASGEQWLSMIQKNGGLKAGEDKWLGLSDWLNERKGKSVTKEEVLDFIRKNQVEVEEVRYSAVRDFNKYGKVDSTTVNLSVFTKHLKMVM